MKLFPADHVVGIFSGFSQGGLEFHADLVLPYRSDFQSTPMHGQFVLVQLESDSEAVLGRVTSLAADGRLASAAGEDYGIRAVSEERAIPEDLREQYLKYRVNIRVLGVVRTVGDSLVFAASHRRLPHVGSPIAFLSDEVMREVAGHNLDGAALGFLALGEFIYGAGDERVGAQPWMQVREPAIVPKFETASLVARRTFVFARAGFGKSNLVKLLFANLYEQAPTVEKRGGRRVPVGTLVFDPDGEYYWPDDKGRPGLCDVEHLEDKLVVFTDKKGPSPFYQSFVAGGIKLDIRRLPASAVIAIALAPERQDQQNVQKLRQLPPDAWSQLVDEIHRHGNLADSNLIGKLLRLDSRQEMEIQAARSNMTRVVRMLHDPSSQMLDMLMTSLRAGKLCVVDVSQLRGGPALVLSGLILQRIFENNQEQFTKAEPQTIPTIAVLEEAQSVLGSGAASDGPYVSWVKEGRKYDLGAVLVTQQPGSITSEILSQGDNWFIFHLLSSGDLVAVKRANAHFTDDLLSALLNEPIPGHGVFWSSVGGKSYPIPIRAMSFEAAYQARDPDYRTGAVRTFAAELRAQFARDLERARDLAPQPVADPFGAGAENGAPLGEEPVDALETYIAAAIAGIKENGKLEARIRTEACPGKAQWSRSRSACRNSSTIGPASPTGSYRGYSIRSSALAAGLARGGHRSPATERRRGSSRATAARSRTTRPAMTRSRCDAMARPGEPRRAEVVAGEPVRPTLDVERRTMNPVGKQ